jgi:hypothetical protein
MNNKSLQARTMLNDSLTAMHMLQDAVDSPNAAKQVPVLWVAAVTMLRAIGHVLHKVDAAKSPAVRALVEQAWPQWRKDPVFQRLDTYRNSALKEYDFGWEHRVIPVWSAPHLSPESDPDARYFGFLFFEDSPADAIEELWTCWHWWDQQGERTRASGRRQAIAGPRQDAPPFYECSLAKLSVWRFAAAHIPHQPPVAIPTRDALRRGGLHGNALQRVRQFLTRCLLASPITQMGRPGNGPCAAAQYVVPFIASDMT